MDISQILSSMSQEDMQRLRQTAQGLLGGNDGSTTQQPSVSNIDPKLLESVGKVAGILQQSDPRCDLLIALKPLLTGERRERIDEAIQMMRMVAVLPRVIELGGKV
ncbi:MAG: hypothetical protein IJ766_01965 [Clostridia bacterium]|nr:hypothetical protein [Clostridia bacterium]